MATVVQSSDGVVASSPASKAFTSSLAVNNHVVVVATIDDVAPTVGMLSNGGTATLGAWQRDTFQTNSTVDAGVSIFSAPITGAGTCTITITSAGSTLGLCLYEISGLHQTTWFDAATPASGTSTTPATGNVTASGPGVLVAGMTFRVNTTSTDPGAPWTAHGFRSDNFGLIPINAQQQVNGAGGSFSCSWTLGASGPWACAVVAYTDAAGEEGGGDIIRAIPTMRVPSLIM